MNTFSREIVKLKEGQRRTEAFKLKSYCNTAEMCSHVMSPSPCPSNTSSKFNIKLMMMNTLTGRMGYIPSLSKFLSKKTKGTVEKKDGVDITYK